MYRNGKLITVKFASKWTSGCTYYSEVQKLSRWWFSKISKVFDKSRKFYIEAKRQNIFFSKFLNTFVENLQTDELFWVKRGNFGDSHINYSLRVKILANIDDKMEYLPEFQAWN